jgi:hypothetical protein
MTTIRSMLAAAVLAVLVGAAVAVPAGAEHPGRIAHPIRHPIPHPTGADVVIFHTETSRNSWGGEYPDAVDVTVFGDGRIGFGDGEELRVTERGLQRLLRGARDAGLLDDTDFGDAGVTDQGTTTVAVTTDAGARTVEVYALELPEGDRGLPKAQRAARRELRRLLHSLDASFWVGTLLTR